MLDLVSFATGFISFPTLAILSEAVILTILIGYDRGFFAFLTLMTVIAGFVWMGWTSLEWFLEHWKLLLFCAVGYIPVGIGWVYLKWRSYLGYRYREAEDYLKLNGSLPNWDYPPQVSKHKSDIMRWLSWWPFSLIGTLLNDPLRRLFEAVYRNIASHLQEISNNMFSNLKAPEPAAPVDNRRAG
jgi:hypothetical protein